MKTSESADFEVDIDRFIAEVWEFVSDLTPLPLWLDEFVEVAKESDSHMWGLG